MATTKTAATTAMIEKSKTMASTITAMKIPPPMAMTPKPAATTAMIKTSTPMATTKTVNVNSND